MATPADMHFLGYVLKRIESRPDWHQAPQVRAICSVSNCQSGEPPTKLDKWTFNGSGCYDSIAGALDSVAPEQRGEYTVFAYHLLERDFVDGEGSLYPEPDWIAKLAPEPMPAQFRLLGYDCVNGSLGVQATGPYAPTMPEFRCSPLSCNGMAETIPTNEWCLLPTQSEAERQAAYFSSEASHVESGVCYVISVWSRGDPVINASH